MSERETFIDWVLSKEGRPYTWPTKENGYSGKELSSAKFKDVFDCSGLMFGGLYHATSGKIDHRGDGNCRKIVSIFEAIHDDEEPDVGDFCLYGPGRNAPTHVMMYLADGRVFGACGGNSDVTSPEIAAKRGARVRFRDSPLYRPDFLGFWKNPL